MAEYKVVKVPKDGAKITMGANKQLQVPDNPIIPYIEGDGTGRDIWKASVAVFDAAVEKAYGGKKKIAWHEVLAGEKFLGWLKAEFPKDFDKIRFSENVGIGIKPVSKEGTERLVRAAIKYAIEH